MFHRVKSEVQETEQRNQQRQKVEHDYRQDEDRAPVAREVRETVEVSREEPQISRPTYSQPEAKEQEEVRSMNRIQQDDKEIQGKYAREPQDTLLAARARSADVSSAPSIPAYQRSAAPAVSAPAVSAPAQQPVVAQQPARPAYAPTYTASTYTQSSAATDAAYSGDRSLTIGRGINMSGEIEACEHLIVEGTVEAALKGAKVLDIAESGTFYGAVEIDEATVAGRFEGDLTVNGRLTIRASGVITGSIAYRELEVEAGAMIDGRMTPMKGNVDPKSADKYRAGSEATAMAKAKDLLSKKDSREPANAENALFSKAHAQY